MIELRIDGMDSIIVNATPEKLRGFIDIEATAALWLMLPEHSTLANRPRPRGIPLLVRTDGEVIRQDNYERFGTATLDIDTGNGTATIRYRPLRRVAKRGTDDDLCRRIAASFQRVNAR